MRGGAEKVLRVPFIIAETNFDPAATSDLYSNNIIEAIIEAPLGYDYLARPAKLKPQTLEAMGRATFKSWFVDFDPVRAKVAGRLSRHCLHQAQAERRAHHQEPWQHQRQRQIEASPVRAEHRRLRHHDAIAIDRR